MDTFFTHYPDTRYGVNDLYLEFQPGMVTWVCGCREASENLMFRSKDL